jgi:hypothetical protein
MEFLWYCMVLSFEVMIGLVLWIIAFTAAVSIIGVLIWTFTKLFKPKNGNPIRDRKEDEDTEEWFKEQMKDKDKWGNA